MRRRFLPALALALVLPACADDPLDVGQPQTPRLSSVKNMVQRGLTGWSRGEFSYTGRDCTAFAGSIPMHVTGSGEASHTGQLAVEFFGCVTLTMDPVPVPHPASLQLVGPGPGTVTAANGDELAVTMETYVATIAHDGTSTDVGTYEITGGTGRFLGATGSFTSTGSGAAGHWQNTFKGTITY